MRINLFDGIAVSEIELAMQNIHNNLRTIAYHHANGHAFIEHSDKSDAYLQWRLNKKNLHSATSYYSAKDTKECCLIALELHWEEIKSFLNSTEETLPLYVDLGVEASIGYGYIKDVWGVFEDCHYFCVVLQKDENLGWGFRIVTTYPIITKDLIPDVTINEKEEVIDYEN